MTEADTSKQRLGALLVQAGLLSAEQLERALTDQKKLGGHVGYCIVRSGFVTPATLAAFFQENPNVGRIQEEATERQKAAQAFPRSLALYYKIVPIKLEGRTLTIALSEISNPHLIETLAEISAYRIDPLICPESEIRSLIESGYRLPVDSGLEFSAFDDNTFVITDTKKMIKALTGPQMKKDTHIGERLRSMIAEAIKEKFREIQIKPQTERTVVFFKKDVLKQSEFELNPSQLDDLTFLLFRLAKMNPLQLKKAQNGRFQVKVNDRKIIMVVGASPSIYGMRFRLEMFDEKILKHTFEDLVKSFPEVHQSFEDFLAVSKKGLFAITGPEGSGRTFFLYSLIARCKELYKNIHTIENSIRYPIAGVHQNEVPDDQVEALLQDLVNRPPDLLVLTSLKSIRQAELAFLLAAQIPVIAVLPSFDAYKAVDWICSHNLKSPVKAGLLHTIISPRIVPHICPYCSIPIEFDAQILSGLTRPEGAQLKMNQGCDHCRGQESAHGEVFFETLRINEEALKWILSDHSAAVLRRQARASGRSTLYDWVVKDAFQHRLDMLSVVKLQAAL
jgi:type IV pilus assembly protein PilB